MARFRFFNTEAQSRIANLNEPKVLLLVPEPYGSTSLGNPQSYIGEDAGNKDTVLTASWIPTRTLISALFDALVPL